MLENLVDVWLTEATERSYEAAFSQLLVIEGCNVVQGAMHHAHEHGKDVIAWDPVGDLCAYQLKGGRGRLDVAGVESVLDQLTTASISTIAHPSLSRARPPDRVYLVTNQVTTGPAQGRVRALSDGLQARGFAPVHLVERAELSSRFVAAEGRFFPSSPSGLNTFLSLFLEDGAGGLPRRDFFRLLEEILPVHGKRARAAEAERSISAAAVTVAFALRRWVDAENHAEVCIGWSCFATQVLRLVERNGLGRARWIDSYRLALEEARRAARRLVTEALSREDVTVGDPSEPLVYSARVVKVCGIASALEISERIEFGEEAPGDGRAARLILREQDCLRIIGEVQAPDFFLCALALARSGEYRSSTQLLFSWLGTVSRSNQLDSESPIADPYHEVEDLLLNSLPPRSQDVPLRDFAGASYTLHIAVRWIARRLWRQTLAATWPPITRIEHYEFNPAPPINYLAYRSEQGVWHGWFYPTPTSWCELTQEAEKLDVEALPSSLLDRVELLPFFCLALPHRFNPAISDLLDRVAHRGRQAL